MRVENTGSRKRHLSIAGLLLFLFAIHLPCLSHAATYENGIFQFDDPEASYTIQFVFDGSSEPLPVSYEISTENHPTLPGAQLAVHRFNIDAPATSAIQNWTVTGNLSSTIVLKRTTNLWSGPWTAVSNNPFRMQWGNFYELAFRVYDPSQFTGERQVSFYFALGRPTYPPAIDTFSAYPTAIAPGETVSFTCEAHDTGTWGSEYLIFKFDMNNDGNYDHEALGVLNPGEEDAFRGIRRAEVAIKYNDPGIYEATCLVENDRGETTQSPPVAISVSNTKLSVVGRPNDPGDLERAIIPPDERFPAHYYLTLTGSEGNAIVDEPLTVRIDDTSAARLEGGTASGSQITVTTDDQGRAEFAYIFLDTPPADKPIIDDITIESVELGIRQAVNVSVGLKLRVMDVTESWDNSVAVPRDLSLRIALADAFRPELNLEEYISSLLAETGQHLGVAITTWWLNRPEPDTLQWIADYIKGFETPPDDILYRNGRGWIKKVNDQFVVNVIDPPMTNVGPHWLPTLTLNGEGLHLFELKIDPVILPEQTGDQSLAIVKAAPSFPFYFGADVYGAESVFKSLVCAFSSTDAEQFLLKAVVLDCPLLGNAQWVGAWASGTVIPYVLLVTEVADLVCNFLEGNHLAVGAALAGKYLARLDSLQESGAIALTEDELKLLKKGLVASSIKKFYDTYNDSVKHFMPEASPSSLRGPLQVVASEETGQWPEDISLAEVTGAVESLSAGVMAAPQMLGLEALAMVSNGPLSVEQMASGGVGLEDTEVDVLIYETGDPSPVLFTAADTTLFRVRNLAGRAAILERYVIGTTGENMVLSFAADSNAITRDLDGDGQTDDFIYPQSTTNYDFLLGDVDMNGIVDLSDGVLALRLASGLAPPEVSSEVLPWAVDVNGDRHVGLAEALYVLRGAAELR